LVVLLAVTAGLLGVAGWIATRPGSPGAGSASGGRSVGLGGATPNVVIFLIDTLRADRVGAYGYDRPTTPHLDALAAVGVVFEQCNAPAPWTLPSVVSLLTSTFPCEHGVLVDGQRVGESHRPLAARLKEVGFATASFYANAYAGPMSGLDRGCDVAQGMRYVDGQAIDQWFEGRPGSPFYLYVHNIEPHNPYMAPDRLVSHFGSVSAETRQLVMQRYLDYRKLTRHDYSAKLPVGTTDNTAEQAEAMRLLDELKDEIEVMYDAVVRHADERVGSVIEVLRRRRVWDNTLLVVTADHGEELADHGGWQHDQSVYEELVRVPLIVRFPGDRFAGRRVQGVVSQVDLTPTILDAVGRPELASGCRGTSLLPLLDGGAQRDFDDLAITALRINRKKYYRPYKETRGDFNVVIREGGFKGIWNVETQTFELYDLAVDPLEQVDLAEGSGDRTASMQRFARAWLDACTGPEAGQTPVHPEELDEESLENLRSLGYVE
jgi:arylsulfatase A-like enzyme